VTFDLVSAKAFMGHAKITTTERYLHAGRRSADYEGARGECP
jgi:hypothetical protein